MKNLAHRCAVCGCHATHTVSDSIDTIIRMDEVFFPCGAILTSSHVDRWQAAMVSHRGCRTTEPVYISGHI